MLNNKYELHIEEIISKELIQTIEEASNIWDKINKTLKVNMYSSDINDGIKDGVVYVGGEKEFIEVLQIAYTINLYELPENQKSDFKCFFDKVQGKTNINKSAIIIGCKNGFFRKYLDLNK